MKKTLKKEGIEWIRTILIGVLLAVFFRNVFLLNVCCRGEVNDADIARW
ncbi:hypothetical protein bthur0004_10360 [Bacillus thuringiensis serovar sotto str. T04001]|nr:hypothetical protein bthur0004_10360 [Bacillus thuringiensis serovar sotto str. T04001]